MKNIKLSELELITYSSNSRSNLHALSSVSIFLSSLTTFIVAPLVSINYENGGFDKNKYFAVAGAGLIGLSVSIPISIFSKPRTYKLTTKNITGEENYWHITTPYKN